MLNRKYLEDFIAALIERKSASEIEDFLKGILTLQELEEIPKRLQIIKLLKSGVPQREIATNLGVGIATVTRGSLELKKGRFKKI
jgi:TrpR family trp operon transcriptional repressor